MIQFSPFFMFTYPMFVVHFNLCICRERLIDIDYASQLYLNNDGKTLTSSDRHTHKHTRTCSRIETRSTLKPSATIHLLFIIFVNELNQFHSFHFDSQLLHMPFYVSVTIAQTKWLNVDLKFVVINKINAESSRSTNYYSSILLLVAIQLISCAWLFGVRANKILSREFEMVGKYA